MVDNKSRAVFFDRDGVLNELVYYPEEGRVGSPLSARQLRVFPNVGKIIEEVRRLDWKAVVISNQPGVARKQFSYSEFLEMNAKVRREVKRGGGRFDGEYYCLHHPRALVAKYRIDCDCRKPKPGLLIKAANELGIDLAKSFFVGDSLIDVKAGRAAGCRTILIATMTDLLNRVIKREAAEPDFMLSGLDKLPSFLKSSTAIL